MFHKMILVLSDKDDKHADVVCQKLETIDEEFFRLNLDTTSLISTYIKFSDGTWIIKQNGSYLDSRQVKKVWVRRPFVEASLQEEANSDVGFRIWRGEWNRSLLGLYRGLKNALWLNPLTKSYQAENKYFQMELAKEVGLKMPQTLVSNEKLELTKFIEEHGSVGLKFMNQEFYKDDDGNFKGLYVNRISTSDITDFKNEGENPIVLQQYIEKDYEVRYTVVGDDHHVCQIQSQKSRVSHIDWRRYDIPRTPHYPTNPPGEIKEKVARLMKALEIEYGALDFIVTPSGEWYFLEINSMGQWLWIEELTGLGISDSIVNLLSRRS